MARKSVSSRIDAIVKLNPALRRDDSRIRELLDAETLLAKCRKSALQTDAVIASRNGVKRHPALVALDAAETSVRRLRADLQIDRVSVKAHENTGVKSKRSSKADEILALFGAEYTLDSYLMPGHAAFLAAHGLEAVDMPVEHREKFQADLEAHAGLVDGIRSRLKQYGMW
jgi:hypothetical protein